MLYTISIDLSIGAQPRNSSDDAPNEDRSVSRFLFYLHSVLFWDREDILLTSERKISECTLQNSSNLIAFGDDSRELGDFSVFPTTLTVRAETRSVVGLTVSEHEFSGRRRRYRLRIQKLGEKFAGRPSGRPAREAGDSS